MQKADVVLYFGSKAKVARFLGITKASITQWADDVPLLWAHRLERLTKGKLKANDPWISQKISEHKAA